MVNHPGVPGGFFVNDMIPVNSEGLSILMQLPQRIAYVISIFCFGGLYYLSGEVGLLIDTGYGGVTPIWPPSGVALFVLLRYGLRYWPGIAIGIALLAWHHEIHLVSAVAGAIAQTMEGTLAWRYLRRFQVRPEFDTQRQVLWFIAIIAGAALTSATLGSMGMVIGNMAQPAELRIIFTMWWLGDAMGMLVIAPFLLYEHLSMTLRMIYGENQTGAGQQGIIVR